MRFHKTRPIAGSPLVGIATACLLQTPRDVAAFGSYLHSMLAQTYSNWKIHVTHDGPVTSGLYSALEQLPLRDPRIVLQTTPVQAGNFGHAHRHASALATGGDILGFTNHDNWYAPVFLELMVAEMQARKARLVYCDMVSSHKGWRVLDTRLKRGHIDLGCWLADRALVAGTAWKSVAFHADWLYLQRLLGGTKKISKVRQALFVHN